MEEVSEPQMPLRLGRTRTQPEPGSSGSSMSPRWSIERSLVATLAFPPVALMRANEGTDRTNWRASIALAPASSPHTLQVLRRAGVGDGQPPVAARHVPPLDAPAALRRDLRQPGVRVDDDGRPGPLQHR